MRGLELRELRYLGKWCKCKREKIDRGRDVEEREKERKRTGEARRVEEGRSYRQKDLHGGSTASQIT